MQRVTLDDVKRSSVAHWNCSVARTLDVVGEWWSLLVVRNIFWGQHRFEDLQADLGIARNILADRLSSLVEAGVLEKRRYQERPERFEYHLTEQGEDLFGVLMELMRWGDRWRAPDGPPLMVRHLACDHDSAPGTVCSHCGGLMGPGDVRLTKGPGFHPLPA